MFVHSNDVKVHHAAEICIVVVIVGFYCYVSSLVAYMYCRKRFGKQKRDLQTPLLLLHEPRKTNGGFHEFHCLTLQSNLSCKFTWEIETATHGENALPLALSALLKEPARVSLPFQCWLVEWLSALCIMFASTTAEKSTRGMSRRYITQIWKLLISGNVYLCKTSDID